jgi:hypothetical protein
VTTTQIRAKVARLFVDHDDTAIVMVADVRAIEMGTAVAAIFLTVVATEDVDRRAVVEETATNPKAIAAADSDC